MSSESTLRVVRKGETFRIYDTFEDEDGTKYDPDTHSIQLYKPDGSAQGSAETSPTNTATGEFYQDLTIPSDGVIGEWAVEWTAVYSSKSVIDLVRIKVTERKAATALYCTGLDALFGSKLGYDDFNFDDDGEFLAFIENTLIPVAMKIIDDHCDLPTGAFAGGATVTDEYHDGDGSGEFFLNYAPVVSVTTLSRNKAGLNAATDWETLTEGPGASTHFLLYKGEGRIYCYDRIPCYDRKNIKVTYVIGFSAVPDTVQQVCKQLVVNALRGMLMRKILPADLTQIVMAGGDAGSLRIEEMELTPAQRRLLTPYINVKVGVG